MPNDSHKMYKTKQYRLGKHRGDKTARKNKTFLNQICTHIWILIHDVKNINKRKKC